MFFRKIPDSRWRHHGFSIASWRSRYGLAPDQCLIRWLTVIKGYGNCVLVRLRYKKAGDHQNLRPKTQKPRLRQSAACRLVRMTGLLQPRTPDSALMLFRLEHGSHPATIRKARPSSSFSGRDDENLLEHLRGILKVIDDFIEKN